jgi:hypothetical protein
MGLAAILFAVAAAGGLVLALLRFGGKKLPGALAIVHGTIAAAGLAALVAVVARSSVSPAGVAALALLALAAVGGFYTASFHLRGLTIPLKPMVLHALAAVAGFATLLVALFA